MSYHVISCHIMSYHVMSYHVIACHVTSCHVIVAVFADTSSDHPMVTCFADLITLPFTPSPSNLPCHSLLPSSHNSSLFRRFLRLNNGYESLFLFQHLKAIGEPIKLTHIVRTVESMSYTNSKLLEQRPILTFMTVKNANTGEAGESMSCTLRLCDWFIFVLTLVAI